MKLFEDKPIYGIAYRPGDPDRGLTIEINGEKANLDKDGVVSLKATLEKALKSWE